MTTTGLLPVKPPKTESVYAGFWIRLASIILDTLILVPVLFFIEIYLDSLHLYVFFLTCIPTFLLRLWFFVYLVKRYGGTPGKLIAGIVILKTNGSNVTWREAILRESVTVVFLLLASIFLVVSHLRADISYFDTLNMFEKKDYLSSLTPTLSRISYWAFNIWTISELIVLLFNKRRRAIHDFIAGTVVVRRKYRDRVQGTKDGNAIE